MQVPGAKIVTSTHSQCSLLSDVTASFSVFAFSLLFFFFSFVMKIVTDPFQSKRIYLCDLLWSPSLSKIFSFPLLQAICKAPMSCDTKSTPYLLCILLNQLSTLDLQSFCLFSFFYCTQAVHC